MLSHRFWSVITQADIPLGTRIGGGLLIPHPNGIAIHPAAEIGPNCLIFQQVTIGTTGRKEGLPRIGAHARIGANAVVIRDVPGGRIAAGVPARLLEPDQYSP